MSNRDLQVAGFEVFPERKWRDGILYFVNGMLRDKPGVTDRPKIHLGDLTIRLDRENNCYYAYGVGADGHPPLDDLGWHGVGCSRVEVEHGLLSFVMNNRIKVLWIDFDPNFAGGAVVALWKQKERGTYRIFTRGIPRSCGGLGPA